jgi:hypothetical protein
LHLSDEISLIQALSFLSKSYGFFVICKLGEADENIMEEIGREHLAEQFDGGI